MGQNRQMEEKAQEEVTDTETHSLTPTLRNL